MYESILNLFFECFEDVLIFTDIIYIFFGFLILMVVSSVVLYLIKGKY